jgi:peptide/nickel transport system permease protein
MLKRLVLGRLADLALVVFGVSVIVFLMIRLIPGDAVAIHARATRGDAERHGGAARPGSGSTSRCWCNTALGRAARHRGFRTSLWTGRPRRGRDPDPSLADPRAHLLSLAVGAGLSVPVGC